MSDVPSTVRSYELSWKDEELVILKLPFTIIFPKAVLLPDLSISKL